MVDPSLLLVFHNISQRPPLIGRPFIVHGKGDEGCKGSCDWTLDLARVPTDKNGSPSYEA